MSPTLKMSFKKSHIVIVKVQTFQKEAKRENTHHTLKSPLVTTVKNSASSLTDFFLMHISSFHMDGIILCYKVMGDLLYSSHLSSSTYGHLTVLDVP